MNRINAYFIGLASIFSGILFIVAHQLNFGSKEFGTVWGNILVFWAHLLLTFTFFGVWIQQEEKNIVLRILAGALGVIGNVIVISIVFVEIAQASVSKAVNVFHTPAIEPMYSFGPFLFVIGMILLGISIIREKLLPAYSGYLLLIGTIVFALASVFVSKQSMIEVIGSIFTGAGLIIIGIKTIQNLKK